MAGYYHGWSSVYACRYIFQWKANKVKHGNIQFVRQNIFYIALLSHTELSVWSLLLNQRNICN